MRFEQLRYLADIAKTGSINKTAQRLFISQQAISKSIKQLEQELGLELLVRTKTGASLTEAGREVVLFADKMLAEGDVLKEKIQKIRNLNEPCAQINIVSTSSVTNLAIPKIIANFNAQERQTQIYVMQSDSFDHVMQLIVDESCDIGLMTINTHEFYHQFENFRTILDYEILVQDELVVVMDCRYYNGQDTCVNEEQFYHAKARTLYNVIPIEANRNDVYRANVITSNDADFHRSMMDKAEAMTMMSGLAYQYYFNSKRYVALEFQSKYPTEMLHVAVYGKNVSQEVRDFIAMMRKEMHVK